MTQLSVTILANVQSHEGLAQYSLLSIILMTYYYYYAYDIK